MRRIIFSIFMLIGLIMGVPQAQAQTPPSEFFPQTGHTISGRFYEFWQQNGGLAVFGYPQSDEVQENGRTVQYFERQRFEQHPDLARPYDVLLGRLGAELLASRGITWQNQPVSPGPAAGCEYFSATQHNVCDQQPGAGFLSYWRSHGLEFDQRSGKSYAESLALLGMPITEPYQETNSSGDSVQVQYFERARFEWHPNNPQAYKVLLGRIGSELHDSALLPQPALIAAETVINYYRAIQQADYDTAYSFWANNGAASGQTAAQFRDGFANTVRVDLSLGQPSLTNNGSVVPVKVLSVINDQSVALGQRVTEYTGSYTVQVNAERGQLVSADIQPHNETLPLQDLASASKLVYAYYGSINARVYATAYTYWDAAGTMSGQSLTQFAGGYSTTKQVQIQLGTEQSQGAAGSIYVSVPILIQAAQNNDSTITYCGQYTMRRSNLPPFDQLGFRIQNAQIGVISPVALGSDQAAQLLNNNCQ